MNPASPTGLPGPGKEGRVARPRWHYVYYLLAAFDVLTVSLSLLLTHRN